MKIDKKLEHDLLSDKYTTVFHERYEDMTNGAPHHFEVYTLMKDYNLFGNPGDVDTRVGKVDFQNGPIKEVGVNGVMNEDLIAMVITRLEHFNNTEFMCRENDMAIEKLEEALMWLGKRTAGRAKRNVEGTHTV